MVSLEHQRVVGIFARRIDAEYAIDKLSNFGFSMNQISVVAIDAERQLGEAGISNYVWYKAHDGTATCSMITGSMLGAIGGCLVGLGFIAVPGVALVVAVGTSGTALVSTLAGAGIGIAGGSLISALTKVGISSQTARVDSDRFLQGEYLVRVNGTHEEVRLAESILSLIPNR